MHHIPPPNKSDSASITQQLNLPPSHYQSDTSNKPQENVFFQHKRTSDYLNRPKAEQLKIIHHHINPFKHHQIGTSVYVKGIPLDTTKEHLANFFEEFGPIIDIHLPVHHITRRPRGFAYIQFQFIQHAEQAISQANNCEFRGCRLFVNWAQGNRKTPNQMRFQDVIQGQVNDILAQNSPVPVQLQSPKSNGYPITPIPSTNRPQILFYGPPNQVYGQFPVGSYDFLSRKSKKKRLKKKKTEKHHIHPRHQYHQIKKNFKQRNSSYNKFENKIHHIPAEPSFPLVFGTDTTQKTQSSQPLGIMSPTSTTSMSSAYGHNQQILSPKTHTTISTSQSVQYSPYTSSHAGVSHYPPSDSTPLSTPISTPLTYQAEEKLSVNTTQQEYLDFSPDTFIGML